MKLISISAMLFDHIAGVYISHDTPWGMAMRIPGRIVAPIMCYMISEGYYYTRSKGKYLLRLILFALLSHIPYNLCMGTSFPTTGVMWSLAMGQTALCTVKLEKIPVVLKGVAVLLCCLLAYYANWNFVGVLWILMFGLLHGDFKKQMLGFAVIGFLFHIVPTFTYLDFGFEHTLPHWYQLFIFAAIPLLALYNGQKGGSKMLSRLFYWFYPGHLLLIYLLQLIFPK